MISDRRKRKNSHNKRDNKNKNNNNNHNRSFNSCSISNSIKNSSNQDKIGEVLKAQSKEEDYFKLYLKLIKNIQNSKENVVLRRNLERLLNRFGMKKEDFVIMFKDRRLIWKEGNLYLVRKSFRPKKREIFFEGILFIKLKDRLVPTYFFYNTILKFSQNIIILKRYDDALKFTYSKDLSAKSYEFSERISKSFYLVKFQEIILGIAFIKDDKGLLNLVNIGDYLHEN